MFSISKGPYWWEMLPDSPLAHLTPIPPQCFSYLPEALLLKSTQVLLVQEGEILKAKDGAPWTASSYRPCPCIQAQVPKFWTSMLGELTQYIWPQNFHISRSSILTIKYDRNVATSKGHIKCCICKFLMGWPLWILKQSHFYWYFYVLW